MLPFLTSSATRQSLTHTCNTTRNYQTQHHEELPNANTRSLECRKGPQYSSNYEITVVSKSVYRGWSFTWDPAYHQSGEPRAYRRQIMQISERVHILPSTQFLNAQIHGLHDPTIGRRYGRMCLDGGLQLTTSAPFRMLSQLVNQHARIAKLGQDLGQGSPADTTATQQCLLHPSPLRSCLRHSIIDWRRTTCLWGWVRATHATNDERTMMKASDDARQRISMLLEW